MICLPISYAENSFLVRKLRLTLIKRQLRLFIAFTVSIQNHKTNFIEQGGFLLGQNRFGFLCCSRMKGMNRLDNILPVSSFYTNKLNMSISMLISQKSFQN